MIGAKTLYLVFITMRMGVHSMISGKSEPIYDASQNKIAFPPKLNLKLLNKRMDEPQKSEELLAAMPDMDFTPKLTDNKRKVPILDFSPVKINQTSPNKREESFYLGSTADDSPSNVKVSDSNSDSPSDFGEKANQILIGSKISHLSGDSFDGAANKYPKSKDMHYGVNTSPDKVVMDNNANNQKKHAKRAKVIISHIEARIDKSDAQNVSNFDKLKEMQSYPFWINVNNWKDQIKFNDNYEGLREVFDESGNEVDSDQEYDEVDDYEFKIGWRMNDDIKPEFEIELKSQFNGQDSHRSSSKLKPSEDLFSRFMTYEPQFIIKNGFSLNKQNFNFLNPRNKQNADADSWRRNQNKKQKQNYPALLGSDIHEDDNSDASGDEEIVVPLIKNSETVFIPDFTDEETVVQTITSFNVFDDDKSLHAEDIKDLHDKAPKIPMLFTDRSNDSDSSGDSYYEDDSTIIRNKEFIKSPPAPDKIMPVINGKPLLSFSYAVVDKSLPSSSSAADVVKSADKVEKYGYYDQKEGDKNMETERVATVLGISGKIQRNRETLEHLYVHLSGSKIAL